MRTRMSLEALLRGAVDYGGLFSPAELSMDAAVLRYALHREGNRNWMLGRFVVPASRMRELDSQLARIESDRAWPVTVLCEDFEDLDRALSARSALLTIEAVELRLGRPEDIERVTLSRPDDIELFIEPVAFFSYQEPALWLDPLKASGAFLKIRTGGSRPEQIPTSEKLARALADCASRRLPLKASAGLHQPIGNGSHGFLNVLMASAVALEGASARDVVELLDDDEPDAFVFEETYASWQQHVIRMESIAASRETFFRRFGSSSFENPVEGLEKLGLL